MNRCSSIVFLHWGWYELRTTVRCTPRISSLGLQKGQFGTLIAKQSEKEERQTCFSPLVVLQKKCQNQLRSKLSESTSKTMSVSNRATCEYSVMRQTSPHGTWGSCLNVERSVFQTANLFMTPLHRLWITSAPPKVWQNSRVQPCHLRISIDSNPCRHVSWGAPNPIFLAA